MRVCCLASGSKGNCTFIESDGCKLLIDVGLSTKEVEKRLSLVGVQASEIDAILITHEHSDHIGGLRTFVNKYHIPVYAHISGMKAIVEKQEIPIHLQISFLDNAFNIKDVMVTPFRLSHDSICSIGYSVSCEGKKVSIMTDTGVAPDDAVNIMSGSDLIILESNHNKKMLLDNPNYSMFLKKRILSVRGHLSNEECALTILRCLQKGYTTQFVLAHLSENNNDPVVAFNEVTAKLRDYGVYEGQDIYIDIALQHKISNIFTIENN